MSKINVRDTEITITSVDDNDYISLTDMANSKESESRAADIIKNWLRNRYTLEFLGTWEQINNPDFKVVEFDHFKIIISYSINTYNRGKSLILLAILKQLELLL